MKTFIPDNYIICEECYRLFFSYVNIAYIIDADSYDSFARSIKTGRLNRVTCPYCKSEFTYETVLYIYSVKYSMAVIASHNTDPVSTERTPELFRLLGMSDYKFRVVPYASCAAEKIRIASEGLDDLKVELFKFRTFKDYKNMDPCDEYITFERIEDDSIIFSHRDFKDDILAEYRISMNEYLEYNPILPDVPECTWFRGDKSWALKYYTEENK